MGALVVASLFPNCFEKAKAGGHFLFFGLIVMTLIKCRNVALAHNVERMSSGGLEATAFRITQRLKRKLNLNINTNPAITYTHCCTYVPDY